MTGSVERTTTHTPASRRIPPEIWLDIFEYATNFVPRLLEIDVPQPFDGPEISPLTDYYDLDALRLSLRTKYSLVLVCRLWHSIGIELLHQVILLDSIDTCRILCESTWAQGLGSSVRHLLLGTLDRKACRYLPTFLRTLSNLKILSLWNATIALSHEHTADAMADTFGHGLRKLHVYGEQLAGQPLVALYDLIHSAPHLRTLIIDCKDIQGAVVLPPLPELTFVSGHSLILDSALARSPDTSTPDDPFPRLTQALLPARRLFSRVHSRAFDALSPSVSTITVDLRRDWEVGPEHDLWAGLGALWTRCPSVTQVQLILAWQQFATSDRFPPQLGTCAFVLPPRATHLALLVTFTGTFRMAVFIPCLEALLGALERAGRAHASLRVVRFVSPVLVERFRQATVAAEFGFVKALHDRCSKLFKMEDHEGGPLLPPPAGALA